MPQKTLYRPDEVARLMGVNVRTVYLWIESGKIPHVRTIGGHARIPFDEIAKNCQYFTVLSSTLSKKVAK